MQVIETLLPAFKRALKDMTIVEQTGTRAEIAEIVSTVAISADAP
jgi:hypothetical protein